MTATSCKRCGAPLSGDEARTALQGMCTKCLFELGLDEESQVVITGAAEDPAPPPTPEELQPLFPQFEILEVLGQGGMGVVYRARQKGLGREVALKVLPARAGRNPAFAERFAREARALASLQHPNITSVYDFGKAGEHFFLAMEFVDGLNLRALLRAQRVAPKQALQIVEQICDALQYAHDQGVVHRDIKPENILLDRKGRLKITDFGLAKLLAREPGGAPSIGLTLTHQVMGTPHYMAPEQIERPGEVDHRADIYSLGVVFYELLTGELPLGRFAPPSGKVQVDVRLDEVVLRALEKERELRYQSAGDVRTDVHGIGEPGSGEKAAAGGSAGAGRHGRRTGHGWRWAVAGVSLLVFAFIAAAFAAMIAPLWFRAQSAELQADPVSVSIADANAEELRKSSEAHVRLEGVPLTTGDHDYAALSLPFRSVFGIEEEVALACSRALLAGRNAYGPLRESSTVREIPEPGVARITIEPFPEPARTVVDDVLRDLRALLPSEAYRYLVASQALERELFPPAAERVVHELRRTPEGFTWSTSLDGTPAVLERGTALPGPLADSWRAMYQPLTPSAAAPLERFMEEVRGHAGEGEVDLGAVRIDPENLNGVLGLELKSNVTFKAGDVVASTQLLEQLTRRLGAIPGFAPATVSTTNRGTAWISVGLQVDIQAPNPELALPLTPAATEGRIDLMPLLNQTASGAGIALREVVPNRVKAGDLWEDVSYGLAQDKSSARSLDDQLAWVRKLEDLGPESVVRSVELIPHNDGPVPSDPVRWLAKVELLVRHPR